MRLSLVAVLLVACGPKPVPSPRHPPPPDPKPAVAPSPVDILTEPRELGGQGPWRLEHAFEAAANESEISIEIEHTEVPGEPWAVELNGRRLGYLHSGRATHLRVPAGAIANGGNAVRIVPFRAKAPITIQSIRLVPATLGQLVVLGTIRVVVADPTGAQQPARVTVVDGAGHPVALLGVTGEATATRHGIVYTLGDVSFGVRPGRYQLFATRGTEWSMGSTAIDVTAGEVTRAALTIEREVDTTGYIAADTHMHALPFSSDASASMAERLVTLAGEGVELAVATDHDHSTDFRPEQRRLGLSEWFLAIVGNEVTTRVGHLNGFPLEPDVESTSNRHIDLVAIVDDLRSRGAKIVTLNHPRFPIVELSVFGKADLNQITGDGAKSLKLTVDAIELANANTRPDDPMVLVADWLALLNRGVAVTAVGVSDTHTVEDPPGEGRTYLRSRTDDVGGIDEDEMYESIKAGRASISVGIFADVETAGGKRPGDVVRVGKAGTELRFRVAAPSWVTPRTAFVFVNGQNVAQRQIPVVDAQPTDVVLSIPVPRPDYDAHVVCVVIGDPVRHAAWKTRRPYTMAATNPLYLDVDGDGEYSAPRDSARRLLPRYKNNLRRIERALPRLDPVIAAQMLSLLRERIDQLVTDQAGRHRGAVPAPHTHGNPAKQRAPEND